MVGPLVAAWGGGSLPQPLTLLGATLTLVLVATVACVLPAWRAASIDPMRPCRVAAHIIPCGLVQLSRLPGDGEKKESVASPCFRTRVRRRWSIVRGEEFVVMLEDDEGVGSEEIGGGENSRVRA